MNNMKRIILITTMLLMTLTMFGQFCSPPTTTVNITPTTVVQNTATYNSGYIAFTFNAIAGAQYSFSTCGLSSADTYLRLYNSSNTLLISADDQCSLQSSLIFNCTTSGAYTILLSNWFCNPLTSNTVISYNMLLSVPSSGNNSYTTCSSILYDHNGSVGNYNNNVNGYTVLYPTYAGGYVQLTGTINTEAGWDFVRIYNGAGLGGTLLYTGSGTANIGTITSTTGPLTVQFTSDGSITYSGFVFNINCSYNLPIELISFDGKNKNNNNILTWSTASESNNDYFTVERSDDGVNWLMIDSIDGAGNSQSIIDYSTVDNDYREVINYYRLKQVDYDGQYQLFEKIVAIDNRALGKVILKVVNSLGQEVELNTSGVVFIIYTNGEIERKFNI